ncbi:HEAT repeat domain-containing protein (plasmid) [Methylobacterium sp. NMS14P]|uniref:HEAT repeat domain-containing protein n=1 Tax=Methylobacterium sp. NMS14P TaxID=2894310 RepID=UPI002359F06E|nr:HEAT repeat domain-containing protein [Methylobacterium sp. NMS14P]WCS28582.1 HEAT repeat domain-containing protein [Methylobacterium sp. NMS14P]
MLDVHEVDTPVPASWFSGDLYCPSGNAPGTRWDQFTPEEFLLFRIVRGRVVARMTAPNTGEEVDAYFDAATPLLDRFIEAGGAFSREIAPGPLEGLAEALHDRGDTVARRHLAGLLWQAGAADLRALVPALTSVQEPDVLRWIGYALSRIGPDAAVAIPDLMRVLAETDDAEVARAMAYALAGIGPAAAHVFPSAIPLVLTRCGQQADRQLELFVHNLERAGPQMIDVLIAGMLAAHDTKVAYDIAFALGRMGLAAVLPLYVALATAGDDRQRSVLARALGRIGPDAGMALDLLLDRLRQAGDDAVRSTMMGAVTEIGLRSPADLHSLRTVFRATNTERVLRSAAEAAATLGTDALGFLLEEFEAGGPAARIPIAKVLGDFGAEAAAAVDAFALAAESSPDRALLDALTQALAKIGAPADVLFTARIRALLHVPGGYWADDGLTGMQKALDAGLRLPEHHVRDLVSALVRFGASSIGRPIAKMLGSTGRHAAEPLLSALDRVQDPDTRTVIFYALGLVGEPAQAAMDDVVIALSTADNDRLRLQLVDDLVRMGQPDERHMATLADVLVRSSFRPVWWRLGLVLAGFGAPAVVTLVRVLDDASDDGLCAAMENALLEVAAADAAARAALLAAVRHGARPRTKRAIQAALNQSSR